MERKSEVSTSLALVILLIAGAAYAQQASPVVADAERVAESRKKLDVPHVEYAPPLLTEPRVSIMDAVRMALAHDPNIRLGETSVNLQRGVVQEISGQFDTILTGNFQFQFTQSELDSNALKAQKDRRSQMAEEAERNREKAENEENILAGLQTLQNCFNTPGCDPGDIDFGSPELEGQIDIIQVLIEGAEDPVERAALITQRNAVVTRLLDLQRTRVATAREAEAKTLDRLRKLGGVPTVDQSFNGSIDLRVTRPTRTGVDLGAWLRVSGDGSNFRGKVRNADRGGKGVSDLYRGEVGVSFDVPLGRGAGVETTTARERAANVDLEASRLFLQHAGSQTVLSVVQAYWDVVAAQQTVAAFEESNRLQSQLVEIAEALIQGDEMPAAELPRVRASQANILGTLSSAQRNLHDARVRLANAMGVRVESEANVPLPTSEIPEPAPLDVLRSIDSAALGAAALDRRFDLLGSRRLQESGGVLLRAAVLDLKPIIDLSLQLSMSGAGESSSVRMGLHQALFHKWVGPSSTVGLSVVYPLGNNVQRGRLVQAQASYDQRVIGAENLARVVRSNVVLTHRALVEAAAQVAASGDAIRYYRELVESEVEKLRLGSSTLIDMILTEQRRTDATLGYIAARQLYAQLLAQLRYESGTLVESTPEGHRVELEFLSRPPATATY